MKMTIGMTLATLALATMSASAQLPQASATALGMGENVTASARGFAAVANNPAGLGMADSPGFSLAIPSVSVQLGLGPVTLADLAQWQGEILQPSTKDAWLQSITDAGGQGGTVGVGATPLALSIGPVGFQVSGIATGVMSLAPDAAEVLLYGNAGRTGSPADLDFSGSTIDGFALTTGAMSVGFPVSDRLTLGVTGKYVVGNALVIGRDVGSSASATPLSVATDFPILGTNPDSAKFNNGTGVGMDIGAIWRGPAVTVGATIQNVFNSFEFTLDHFSYIPGQALFNGTTNESDFDQQPAANAPTLLRDAAADLKLKPVFAAGAQIQATPLLEVEADVRKRVGGGLDVGPEFQMGVGAELRALSFLPLRAHAGVVSGGVQIGGGASLILGPVNLSGAIALRTNDIQNATLGMLTLSFGGN